MIHHLVLLVDYRDHTVVCVQVNPCVECHPMLGCKSFDAAQSSLTRIKLMRMIKQGRRASEELDRLIAAERVLRFGRISSNLLGLSESSMKKCDITVRGLL